MATRIDPPSLRSKPYELYRQELLAWREVTELRKEKQGVAIALSLPENDKTQIREKVFEQISIEDLKMENGLDTLITFLDEHLKKDDLADSLEKFEEFEDFQRINGMSITEYIASFDTRYRKIEKLKMSLPSEILAFKLLRKANISKEEKLVLTGMDYSNKVTLYEEAKKSLKKFMADFAEGSSSPGSGSGIKLEPSFLADNEEALLAAGYVKQNRGGKAGKSGRGGFGRGRQADHGQLRKMNPLGPDGKTLTCRCCGSYRHFIAECPHSWENASKGSI